ncbi:MAG TPA: DUF4173 domain-containing protein [Opitutaceae bacterium]|nr:DUF4173 domain-containing protein [Opitutaceae bacterium]
MSDNPIFDAPLLCAEQPAATREFSMVQARRYAVGVLGLVAATDILFYERRPGVSIAIFGVLALLVLRWNRPRLAWDRYRVLGLVLITLALAQSVFETGFSNMVSLFALFSFAMIDVALQQQGNRFTAPFVAAGAWLCSPLRWGSLLPALETATGGDNHEALAVRAVRKLGVIVPALLLLIPFALLLGSGNVVIGHSLSQLASWLVSIHLPPLSRFLFWGVTATGAMTFLAPSVRVWASGAWLERWRPTRDTADAGHALWRTWLMLAAVNALFCWANTVDAVFLWVHAALPAGVSYSEFLHDGVYSLIAATLLSGIVLTWLFEQDRAVAAHRVTRTLGFVWIAQNLLLLFSVGLRLKLYIEAYDLTVLRLGTGSFLVLVAAGFALLSWRIQAAKSLRWLILSNLFAVCGLFYVLQFADLAGVTARYNTRRWLDHQSARIDVRYLERLGAPAWPSLRLLERTAPDEATRRAATQALVRTERRFVRYSGWQSWQWREATLRKEVFSNPPAPAIGGP